MRDFEMGTKKEIHDGIRTSAVMGGRGVMWGCVVEGNGEEEEGTINLLRRHLKLSCQVVVQALLVWQLVEAVLELRKLG